MKTTTLNSLYFVLLLAAGLLAAGVSHAEVAAKQPNILFIVVDDLRPELDIEMK